jgi:endonuclease-8
MPEGPSMLIASEEISEATGKKLIKVSGNSKEPVASLKSQKLVEVGTWGKHLLLFFEHATLKIHFLMFGSYSVNKKKPKRKIRLALDFGRIKIYFYTCSVKFLSEDANEVYDWKGDVLSPMWDASAALTNVLAHPNEMVCDVLMNQQIFSGVGNIIKNEVQFILKLLPQRKINSLTKSQQRQLVYEAQDYSWKFYYWKKNYELKKHWQIMRKKICPTCEGPVTKEPTGKLKRLSHYCKNCQK